MLFLKIVSLFLILNIVRCGESSSTCHISEESVSILTYPFSHPMKAPQLIRDVRIYPYSSYLEYTSEGEQKLWKVVKLENELVSVYVLPQVGGKVWYAEINEGGRDFLYRNGVLKFRGIGLRGPWTSGGIEFNIGGVFGHTPSATSQVSYRLIKDESDGSVSVVVGSFDLPSRTFWRTEIRLEPGKAKFQTKSTWYNPTSVRQAYYTWMNSATKTAADLQLCYYGTKYVEHDGDSNNWPIDDKGRDLSFYAQNGFGAGSKSYHVVGKYNNFYGAYYHQEGAGYGHFSPYDDIPGKKAFMWSLSGAGKIWEKLLTDTSGQYMEMQAGRLFVQYAYSPSHTNPISRYFFEPYLTDSWVDVWAPVENIGGITDMSSIGAMSISFIEELRGSENVWYTLKLGICSFESVKGASISIKQKGVVIYAHTIDLEPLQTFVHSVSCGDSDLEIEVTAEEMNLYWTNVPEESNDLARPFATDPAAVSSIPEFEKLIDEGKQYMAGRYYETAVTNFDKVLSTNPWNKDALIYRAEMYYRSGLYDSGLQLVNKILQLDTYHPEANYLAGILYRAKKDYLNAEECLGWASRSLLYRSVSLAQKAELAMIKENLELAITRANSALEFNVYNIPALQTLAISGRLVGDKTLADHSLETISKIDLIPHFVNFEKYLWNPTEKSLLDDFEGMIRCEYPEHVYLELSLIYRSRGLDNIAIQLLDLGSKRTKNSLLELWHSFLLQSSGDCKDEEISKFFKKAHYHAFDKQQDEELAYPYRRESIEVLEWAAKADDSNNWIWQYLLAVLYWSKQRNDEAAAILDKLGDEPDLPSFFVARAFLLHNEWSTDQEKDLVKALELGSSDWFFWMQLISYYQNNRRYQESLNYSTSAYEKFSTVPDVALAHVRSLINQNKPLATDAVEVLRSTIVLPTESNSDSRTLWEWSFSLKAMQKIRNESYNEAKEVLEMGYEWPEYNGVGRPYHPDERMFDFLMAYSYKSLNGSKEMMKYYEKIVNFTISISMKGVSASYSGVGRMEDYYAFVVLMNLGEVETANALIAEISKESNQDVYVQWVVACARHDMGKIGELKKDYPSIFNGFGYNLLVESLRVVKRVQKISTEEEICLEI